jgi:hypothetical protein
MSWINGFYYVVSMITIIAAMLVFTSFEDLTSLASSTNTFSEGTLTIKHDIQTTNKSNICMYSISVQVLNNQTLEVVSNALVEFMTPNAISSNITGSDGNTLISLTLEKSPLQKDCTEALLSQGYSIEASREGYIGYGFGKVF